MRKTYTIGALLAVTSAAVLSMGSAALATGGGHGGGHDPVTICHKPHGPHPITITVDDDAVPAHLWHGDYVGSCVPVPPPPTDDPDPTPTDDPTTEPTDEPTTEPSETPSDGPERVAQHRTDRRAVRDAYGRSQPV